MPAFEIVHNISTDEIEFLTPKLQAFLDDFKASIPRAHRRWEKKRWVVSAAYRQELEAVLVRHFPSARFIWKEIQ